MQTQLEPLKFFNRPALALDALATPSHAHTLLLTQRATQKQLEPLKFFGRPALALDAVGGDSAARMADALTDVSASSCHLICALPDAAARLAHLPRMAKNPHSVDALFNTLSGRYPRCVRLPQRPPARPGLEAVRLQG